MSIVTRQKQPNNTSSITHPTPLLTSIQTLHQRVRLHVEAAQRLAHAADNLKPHAALGPFNPKPYTLNLKPHEVWQIRQHLLDADKLIVVPASCLNTTRIRFQG